MNPCDLNADCKSNNYSAICQCNRGFVGDGYQCQPYTKPSSSEMHSSHSEMRSHSGIRSIKPTGSFRPMPSSIVPRMLSMPVLRDMIYLIYISQIFSHFDNQMLAHEISYSVITFSVFI